MPDLKPMTIIYPVLPAKDEAERAALRPIGRNRDIYNAAIHGATQIVQAADDMDLWGVGTIEHHFWSEGYEVAPAPGAIQAYWATLTKRINVGCARLRHGDAQPGPGGRGNRGDQPPCPRPQLRRAGARLPVALDQRARAAFRHPRHQVALGGDLQSGDAGRGVLHRDAGREGPR
jgi:hypothetical protein